VEETGVVEAMVSWRRLVSWRRWCRGGDGRREGGCVVEETVSSSGPGGSVMMKRRVHELCGAVAAVALALGCAGPSGAVGTDSGALADAATAFDAGSPGDAATAFDAGPREEPGPYPAGLTDHTITVGEVEREYRVHVPPGTTTPRAVVVVLHGGGGEGTDVANLGEHPLSVFRAVADREGFVVVYPAGLPSRDATGRVGWVDCRADNLVASDADDVAFLERLVERVREEYGLSSGRMFMAGGSNGAQMTHAFAFARPDLLGAVATFAGSLPETPLPGTCTTGPSQPLPIVILHGTADTQMPWAGGCVANLGGACNRGRVISAEATRDRWLEINGLASQIPTESVVELSSDDAGPANRFDYAGANPVRWWRLDGAGHTVASRTVLTAPNPATGTQNRDVEYAEVAWEFFAERLPD
jgi:polyhydroxybutyrate depolymerase